MNEMNCSQNENICKHFAAERILQMQAGESFDILDDSYESVSLVKADDNFKNKENESCQYKDGTNFKIQLIMKDITLKPDLLSSTDMYNEKHEDVVIKITHIILVILIHQFSVNANTRKYTEKLSIAISLFKDNCEISKILKIFPEDILNTRIAEEEVSVRGLLYLIFGALTEQYIHYGKNSNHKDASAPLAAFFQMALYYTDINVVIKAMTTHFIPPDFIIDSEEEEIPEIFWKEHDEETFTFDVLPPKYNMPQRIIKGVSLEKNLEKLKEKRLSDSQGVKKASEMPIRQIDENGHEIRVFKNRDEASEVTKISKCNVTRIANGNSKCTKKCENGKTEIFIFEYILQ